MKLERVGTFNKVRAVLILWLVVQGICIIGIYLSGKMADYTLFVLQSDSNILLPERLMTLTDNSNLPFGRIVSSAIIQISNNVLFLVIGASIALVYIGGLAPIKNLPNLLKRNKSNSKVELMKLSPQTSESCLSLIEPVTQRWIDKPFHETYLAVRRIYPKTISKENSIDRLTNALMGILSAYPDVPASNEGYHGNTTLKQHSISVAKEALKIAKEMGIQDPLLTAACLAHDLEKIYNYRRRKDGKWVKISTHSRQVCTAILVGLPEFSYLNSADRQALVRTVRYYHNPNAVPLDTVSRTKSLIKVLSKADKMVTKRERENLPYNEEKSETLDIEIEKAFVECIEQLNINNSIEAGHADGWTMTALEFVAVPEENIRRRLKQISPPSVIDTLQLEIPFKREGHHPARDTIVNKLKEMDYLITRHNEIASDSGLFDIRNGKHLFLGVALLSKKVIEQKHPGLLTSWGSSRFRLIIEKAHKPKLAQENQ